MKPPQVTRCFAFGILALVISACFAQAQAPVFSGGGDYAWSNLAGLGGGSGTDDGTLAQARFRLPGSIAIGSDGSSYIADTFNNTIRKISPAGVVTTLAGTPGIAGSTNGTGRSARFSAPSGVAVDSSGNVYVADSGNHVIRKITPEGLVTTLAGSPGALGTANGTGSAARFNTPTGIVVTGDGTLFVTDRYNSTIRRVTSEGVVSTFAGSAKTTGTTDGTGSAARFGLPSGIVLSPSGDLYVCDGNAIRRITSNAVVTTPIGNTGVFGSADGSGSTARFYSPQGIAVDSAGNLYVSDTYNHTIRKVVPSGADWVVTTLAGKVATSGSTNGTGTNARFYNPTGIAVNPSGELLVADSYNSLLRKVTQAGVVTIYSGSLEKSGTTNATGTAARFQDPTDVAVTPDGTLYVADSSNFTIRQVTPGGVVTTFAGKAATSSTLDGNGGNARFSSPQGLTMDAEQNLYVTDRYAIRMITPSGDVTTIAGSATAGGSTNGVGASARFNWPRGIARDTAGNLYVADTSNHIIRKLTFTSGNWTVSTLAGAAGTSGSADGTGSTARFNLPSGIGVDAAGNIYVADNQNFTIRRITPAGVVTTIAGRAQQHGSEDGLGGSARFRFPQGLVVDSAGTIFVSDTQNNTIRKIVPSGSNWVVSTIGGTALSIGSLDGIGSAASFSNPIGLKIGSDGKIYLADSLNNRVVVGNNNALSTTGYVGSPFSYQVSASGSPTSFNATNLPAGLTINPTTGLISGTPTTAGVVTSTLSATNASGTGTAPLIISILNPSLPTITISASPSAGGVVTGGGSFASGTSVTVTATPNSGYTFVNWTENGTQVSTSSSLTFTVSGSRTLRANFQAITYNISAVASPSAGGSVAGSGSFANGSNATLTATPGSGYTFVNWTENGNPVSTSPTYSFTVSGNRSLTANFLVNLRANAGNDILLTDTLQTTLNGSSSGGTPLWSQVSGPGEVLFGSPGSAVTTVQLPQAGIYVLRLTTTGASSSVSDEVTITAGRVPVSADAGGDVYMIAPTMQALLAGLSSGGIVQWSQVSGPGPATFANANSAVTTVQLPQLGTYVLRLTTTGETTVSDDVTVTVVAADTPGAIEAQTVSRLSSWARIKAGNGPQGRPLPLAASWAAGAEPYSRVYYFGAAIGAPVHDYFVIDPLLGPGPDRRVQEIKQGRHVMITFEDVVTASGISRPASRFVNEANFTRFFDNYYRPALEYARTHKLPIAIRGFNWADVLVRVENGVAGRGRVSQELGPDDTAKLIQIDEETGQPVLRHRIADPFGPVSRWEEFGRIWMGHEVMQKIQEVYPDPPLVVFINNHEIGEVTDPATKMVRFDALYPGTQTPEFRATKIREAYGERYDALFASARAAFVEKAWRDNAIFIAYNNQPTQILGRGAAANSVWTDKIDLDPATGFTDHLHYDGGSPEYYDNQWQAPWKGDWSPWSPQTEASNMIAYQDAKVWAENPNFYWSSSLWGGDMPSNIYGRPGRYLTDDYSPKAKWDIDRYTGMLQFGLWMLRPREFREFRGEDDLRGFNGLTWNALMDSVDRVWNDPTLTEFWKFGKLVHNPVFGTRKHYFSSVSSMPTWMREMDRWFLLTSDANASELSWPIFSSLTSNNALKVFALALQLGEAPSRRWLVYAHAPLGSVAGSRVTIPGLGSVVLDYISRSGSFFTVNEGSLTATPFLRGGPAEIALTASARHIQPGGSVTVTPELRHPAKSAITGYTWRVPGQADRTSSTLGSQTFTFATAGERIITLEATTADGTKVVEQIPVWVRPAPPADGVVMDLPLRSMYSWSGPWGTDLQSGALQTFRYQPNASVSFDREAILRGGNIVNDSTEGNVLEVRTANDGLIIPRSTRTTMSSTGHSDMAIGFRFKAEDVQRRQLLYSQGWDERPGISIYLHNGRIYAGSWRMSKEATNDWLGAWTSAPVVANRWYEVSFALKDASLTPRPGVASLSLDGNVVGTAAGVRLPLHHGNPRLSLASLTTSRTAASAHSDGVTPTAVAGSLLGASDFFVGRLADFTFSTGPGLAAERYLQTAVNAGGESQPGSTGITFGADTGGDGGVTGALPPLIPVETLSDPEIYRTYRMGGAFSYAIPLPNGGYNVRLMFLEPEDRSTPRLFNVDLEGNRVLTDFNIQEQAGVRQGIDRTFSVQVTDGTLNLDFTGSGGSEAVLSGFVIEKQPLTTPGLIGHWRLDERSGATAYDTSGLDRDLKFATEPGWNNGVVFSGATTPQARTDSNFSAGTGNKLTVSMWVRPQGMSTSNATLISNTGAFRIALNSLRITAFVNGEQSTDALTANSTLVDGNWHHIALVYDGALALNQRNRLYINGVLDQTWRETSTSLPSVAAKLFLGQRDETTTDPKFTGQMRDVRILTAALTATEIGALAGTVTGTPVITAQPESQTVQIGETAVFNVSATGTPNPTFQWQRNNVDIPGATSATYMTPATVVGDNAATYRAIVRNSAGAVTSQPAILTIQAPLTITSQPTSQTVNAGETASFSVTATGLPSPSFQWQRNSVDIPGATAQTFSIPAANFASDNGASYRVVISNGIATVVSNSVTLTVRSPLTTWRAAHFSQADLSDPSKATTIWGNSADPDGDGLNNLLEYALGRSPVSAQTEGRPTLGISTGNRATVSFQRNPALTDLSYTVEASSDLITWTPIAQSTAGGAMQNLGGAFNITESGTSPRNVTVEDNQVLSPTAPKRFLRLKITEP